MAFVFRSQKQPVFLSQKNTVDPPEPSLITNQQSRLNGTIYSNIPSNPSSNSPSKIVKGLPTLLRKNETAKPDNFKQNDIFRQTKYEMIKPNPKPIKKVISNYFFSSNVPKDIQKVSSKISDKSFTCSQFNTSTNDQIYILNQKKQNMTSYKAKNISVNKNLVLMEEKNVRDFRKPQNESIQIKNQADQILIDCSKQQIQPIKRKSSSPHALDKTSYNQVLHKLKSFKEKSAKKSANEQGDLYMKISEELKPLKKSQTEKKLSKLHKGNLQSSFYNELQQKASDSEEQENHATPGPGSYDNTLNLKQMKSFRSKKEKFAKIFGSPLERFKREEVKYHEITYVNEENLQKAEKIKKNHVFLSCTPRILPLEKKSDSPEPGFYNCRKSLEHDIVKHLLKNTNIASFNSTLPRFKQEKSNLTPGPGQYNVDCLEMAKLQEIRNSLSSCYKSQVQRCLDYVKQNPSKELRDENCTLQEFMDKKHMNYLIHKREQQFDSSEFFSPPAFFSGVQRFKEMTNESSSTLFSLGLPSKNFNKEQKNTQPFNSSQERKLSKPIGQGVGVGSYLIDKDRWNKKSYNIFFH